KRYGANEITCNEGIVSSTHTPRNGSSFDIAGDEFQNKFVIDTPIDGFGRPSVYLSLLRLLCANGAIGYSPAFRSELNVGRTGANAEYALLRVLDGCNNEQGYAAMRQRFESASRSWASVSEVNTLCRLLARLLNRNGVAPRLNTTEPARTPVIGGDGASA